MEILLILITGTLSVVCFLIGAKVGQTVARGEEVKLPTINPIERIRERKDKKEAEWEQDRINTILQNVESYDGTANGQKDVPRG